MQLVEKFGFEVAILPKDITGAAQTGDWMSLKNFSHCTIILMQGAWAGGTPAVTLQQAQDVAGTGAKALAFGKMWTKVGVSGTTWVETAVVNNTFNAAAVAQTMYAIEVDAAQLDVNGGFDCVTVLVASPGANADLLSALYILSGARYPQATMIDAKVN